MHNLSIVRKLIVYFLLLNILTVITIGAYSYFRAKDALVERTFDQLTSIRIEKKYRIERFFDELIKDVNLVSKSEDALNIVDKTNLKNSNIENDSILKNQIEREYKSFLQKHLFSGQLYKRMFIINNKGITVLFEYKDANNSLINFAETEQLSISDLRAKIIKDTSVIIEDYKLDTETNQPKIFIGSPIIQNSEEIIGAVILEINIEAINTIMYENNPHNGLGESGESYLVGSDYLMRSTSRFQNNSVFKTKVKTEGVINAFDTITGKDIITDYRGVKVLSSFGTVDIPGLNWAVLAEIDEEEAMIPIVSIRNNILYISMILTLFLFALVYIIARRISLPIIKLKDAALKMKQGDYNVKVENLEGNDEIAKLIVAFNEMSSKIKEQTENLTIEKRMRLSSVIDGQEIERQRLSRELHDGLGQSILSIKMRLERTKKASPEKIKEINEEILTLIAETITEIRNISNNLMPTVLDEFGLVDALYNLCKDVNNNLGIKITFNHDDFTRLSNDKINTYLYRISQEALNNIIKHSNADSANVFLRSTEDEVILKIQDFGDGFLYSNEMKLCGNGINNIKERVQLLKGKINFNSEKNEGTLIEVIIPVTSNDYGKDKNYIG